MNDFPPKDRRRSTDLIPHAHAPFEPCHGDCRDIVLVTEIVTKTKQEIDDLDDRIKESRDQLVRFEARLTEGDARMGRIEGLISKNSSEMVQNTSDTAEILQIMRDTKSAFRMIELLGTAVKWFSGLAVALGSAWLLFKDFKK